MIRVRLKAVQYHRPPAPGSAQQHRQVASIFRSNRYFGSSVSAPTNEGRTSDSNQARPEFVRDASSAINETTGQAAFQTKRRNSRGIPKRSATTFPLRKYEIRVGPCRRNQID